MKNIQQTLFILGLVVGANAQASEIVQPNQFLDLSLEELMNVEIMISTTTKVKVRKAPSLVTVITQSDLKLTGATNISEALEAVPGLHVTNNYFANRPLPQFRGSAATQTLLMINGNSMSDLVWQAGIFWKGLPVSMIERVEIIRGPGSAIFGSDASAGVINIITKTAGDIEHTEVGFRTGSFSTNSVWGQHATEINGYKMSVTADLMTTDGHDPFIEEDRQLGADPSISHAPGEGEYGWDNLDLRFSIAKDNWKILSSYMHHDNLEVGLTGAGVLDPVTQAQDSRFKVDWLYKNEGFREHWELDAEAKYQHLAYDSNNGFQERPEGFASNTYPDGQINHMASGERRVKLELSGLYSGKEDHSIKIGGGYKWQDLYRVEQEVNFGIDADGNSIPAGSGLVSLSDSDYAFAPERSREIIYAYVQDIWSLSEDWQLTTGLRYDHYSDFGKTINPRLALVWETNDKLTTKLLYGQAFRAPSYQQLYAITSFSLPDSNLKPEQSETVDLVFSFRPNKDLHVTTNFFYFDQTDIIARVDTGLSTRQYQNAGDHTIRGFELEALWQVSDRVRMSANYTVRSQNESEFKTYNQADKDGYFRVDWQVNPRWNWNVQANWFGERVRQEGDSRDTLDSHLVTDTTLLYNKDDHWEFTVSVKNIFDEEEKEYTGQGTPNDFPLAGRNFFAQVKHKF